MKTETVFSKRSCNASIYQNDGATRYPEVNKMNV